MDPNNNQQSDQAPQDNPFSAAPQTTPTPDSPPSPSTSPSPYATTPPSNGGGKKIAIIVGSVLAGLLVLFLIFVLTGAFGNLQKRAKAEAVVTKFFTYSLEKNNEGLATLYDDKEAAAFVDHAASKVDKSCPGAKQSYKDTSSKTETTAEVKVDCGTRWLIGLTYSDTKKDWNITKLVFNGGGPSTNTDTTTPAPDKALACVEPADVNQLLQNAQVTDIYRYFYSDNIFFTADSASYESASASQNKVNLFADFYKNNSHKAFSYHIKGSVNEGAQTAEGKALADKRADVIKTSLVAAGVPADRIVVDEPRSVANQYITEASRNVEVSVVPSKDCGNAAPSQGR